MPKLKLQTKVIRAYNKAIVNFNIAEEEGFKFRKNTVTKIKTFNEKIASGAKITTRDLLFFQQFRTAPKARKKATSYIDEQGKRLSTREGIRYEKRKARFARQENIRTIDAIIDKVQSLPDTEMDSYYRERTYVYGKDKIIPLLESIKDMGGSITKETSSFIMDTLDKMEYIGYQEGIDDAFAQVETVLHKYLDSDYSETAFGEMSTIGTPFEEK